MVLASPEKLGAVSPYLVAPIGEISGLVTNAGAPDELVGSFERRGLRVIRA